MRPSSSLARSSSRPVGSARRAYDVRHDRSRPRQAANPLICEADPPAGFQYWFMGDDLTEIVVGGDQAFITDLVITVSGSEGITLDEVLAVTESLQPMTNLQWEALQVSALGNRTQVATTVVADASDVLLPTSTASTTTTASD